MTNAADTNAQDQHAIAKTTAWLETCVIGLNLCPFAAQPTQEGRVRIAVCDQHSIIECAYDFKNELVRLLDTSPAEIETSLLIFTHAFEQFDEFWAFVEELNTMLEEGGLLDDDVQLASFHPRYCFEGEVEDARSNHTNRAPYPTVHLIRQNSMKHAIKAYGEENTDNIPINNIERLEAMTDEAFEQTFLKCL